MNTTDIIICTFDEVEGINKIIDETKIPLRLVSNRDACGGPKSVIFDSYAACVPCVGSANLQKLVNAFKYAGWNWPEYTSMTISDDNDDSFSRVYCVTEQERKKE